MYTFAFGGLTVSSRCILLYDHYIILLYTHRVIHAYTLRTVNCCDAAIGNYYCSLWTRLAAHCIINANDEQCTFIAYSQIVFSLLPRIIHKRFLGNGSKKKLKCQTFEIPRIFPVRNWRLIVPRPLKSWRDSFEDSSLATLKSPRSVSYENVSMRSPNRIFRYVLERLRKTKNFKDKSNSIPIVAVKNTTCTVYYE